MQFVHLPRHRLLAIVARIANSRTPLTGQEPMFYNRTHVLAGGADVSNGSSRNGVGVLGRSATDNLSPEERLKLRQARLQAQRKRLEAQLAENAVEALLATLEGRYGLLDDVLLAAHASVEDRSPDREEP